MKKSDVFKNLAMLGLAFVPGGKDAKDAIVALVKHDHDDDPTNDVDEIADKIADAVIKSFAAASNFHDYDLNASAVQMVKSNIVTSIKLLPHVLVKSAT